MFAACQRSVVFSASSIFFGVGSVHVWVGSFSAPVSSSALAASLLLWSNGESFGGKRWMSWWFLDFLYWDGGVELCVDGLSVSEEVGGWGERVEEQLDCRSNSCRFPYLLQPPRHTKLRLRSVKLPHACRLSVTRASPLELSSLQSWCPHYIWYSM